MWPFAVTIEKVIHDSKNPYKMSTSSIRYDNITLSPLLLLRGLRIGPIQRNGAVPAVIHTGRFFVLIPLKGLEKLTGVKDKYI
jgi:hypothetical protein